jgi:hypothetical protein
MILKQKRFFLKRTIELREEGFVFHESNYFRQMKEAEIPYEDLSVNRIYKNSETQVFWLGMSGLTGFFFLATFISKVLVPETKADWEIITLLGFLTLIFSLIFFWTRKNEVYITTVDFIIPICRTVPNESAVNEFVIALRSKAKAYVKNKYLNQLNGDAELRNLRIESLYEQGFITQSEFNDLLVKEEKN